jgi:hypothetical protein
MLWGLLVFIAVLIVIQAWEYLSDVQEYRFAQPATLERHDELSRLLQEKIPLAVEVGALPWRPEIAEASSWKVFADTDGSIQNPEELATEIELTTGLSDLNAGRPWWWVPELRTCRVNRLNASVIQPLTWVTAERTWVGCSSGAPVTVWLVHGRYRRFLKSASSINPWTVTVSELPWWGRVQFVEVTVKPGWCLGIPAHWGFATQSTETSWIWTGDQHSMASLFISQFT